MGPQPGRHRRKAGESVRSLVARLERAGVCFPLNSLPGDFPGGPGVKNLPSSAGDESSILDCGTEIHVL